MVLVLPVVPGIVSNSFLFRSQEWLHLDAEYVVPYTMPNSSIAACRSKRAQGTPSLGLATSQKRQGTGSKLWTVEASPRPQSSPH